MHGCGRVRIVVLSCGIASDLGGAQRDRVLLWCARGCSHGVHLWVLRRLWALGERLCHAPSSCCAGCVLWLSGLDHSPPCVFSCDPGQAAREGPDAGRICDQHAHAHRSWVGREVGRGRDAPYRSTCDHGHVFDDGSPRRDVGGRAGHPSRPGGCHRRPCFSRSGWVGHCPPRD